VSALEPVGADWKVQAIKDPFKGKGAKAGARILVTPGGGSEYRARRDEGATPLALVVVAGKTEFRYHLRAFEDLHAMLKGHCSWMPVGIAGKQTPAAEGWVKAWTRWESNAVQGWSGPKKGLRECFAMCVPPVPTALKLAEVAEKPRNDSVRGQSRIIRKKAGRECLLFSAGARLCRGFP
jgi:hypothetical protein